MEDETEELVDVRAEVVGTGIEDFESLLVYSSDIRGVVALTLT